MLSKEKNQQEQEGLHNGTTASARMLAAKGTPDRSVKPAG
jgi:hypothetical protein